MKSMNRSNKPSNDARAIDGSEVKLTTSTAPDGDNRAERSEVVVKIHQIVLAYREVQIEDLVQQTGLNEHSVRSEVERLVKRGSLIPCKHPKDRRRRIYKLTSDMVRIRDMQKRMQAFQPQPVVKLLPTSTAFLRFKETLRTIHNYEPGSLKREHLVDLAFQQLRTVELDEGGAAAPEPLQAFLYFKRLQLEHITGRKTDPKLAWRIGELQKILEEANSSSVAELREFHFQILFIQYITQGLESEQIYNQSHLTGHHQMAVQAAIMAAREVGGDIESSPIFFSCLYSVPFLLGLASRKALENLQIPVEKALRARGAMDDFVRESEKVATSLAPDEYSSHRHQTQSKPTWPSMPLRRRVTSGAPQDPTPHWMFGQNNMPTKAGSVVSYPGVRDAIDLNRRKSTLPTLYED